MKINDKQHITKNGLVKKNPSSKMRKVDDPYEIWVNDSGWEWRVLKKHQIDDNKPYARWLCAVKSPSTFGSYDYGDVYVNDIKNSARKLETKVHYPITDRDGNQSLCKKCKVPLKHYDGALGYEALYCPKCGYYSDHDTTGQDNSFIGK
jgi:hypothetical protein